MAKTRPADFDLASELAKPSFTPAQKDAPALVELVVKGEEPAAGRAAIALGKMGPAARTAVVGRLDGTAVLDDGARVRLIAVVGHLARAGDAAARDQLIRFLESPLVRVRRAAIGALGKVGGDEARTAVIARWDAADVPPDERRTLAEALGKLGGDGAIARLTQTTATDDAELARRRDRGLLIAEREAKRGASSWIAYDRQPPKPLRVILGCKPGLGGLLAEQLETVHVLVKDSPETPARVESLHPQPIGDAADRVAITLAAEWSKLYECRLWATAAIELPMRWTDQGITSEERPSRPAMVWRDREDRVEDPEALASAIARAITAPDTLALLRAWTTGAIRWRLGFARGHKRSIVWQVAKQVGALAPELINDPTDSTWEFVVDDVAGTLVLIPKRISDYRFSYRTAEIPAASHPSVAAALAFVAQIEFGDHVWDPFCGSGLELAECGKIGNTYMGGAQISGSDIDPAALAAARANLDAATVRAELEQADARTFVPRTGKPITAIVTNPPLGSRVHGDAGGLLVECLPNFAKVLEPGGRLVWITPAPRKTTPVAERLGLRRSRSIAVDLGGVRGMVERWDKPR